MHLNYPAPFHHVRHVKTWIPSLSGGFEITVPHPRPVRTSRMPKRLNSHLRKTRALRMAYYADRWDQAAITYPI